MLLVLYSALEFDLDFPAPGCRCLSSDRGARQYPTNTQSTACFLGPGSGTFYAAPDAVTKPAVRQLGCEGPC